MLYLYKVFLQDCSVSVAKQTNAQVLTNLPSSATLAFVITSIEIHGLMSKMQNARFMVLTDVELRFLL